MKKFLSLVLSLAMAMSLVTVGAGAKEFKDDSKIAYDEAVAVISELGVVDGYESGNFNPEGGLTRGAAAKIICNMVLGPTTASALSADAKSFKDVPTNHPFAGYIAYCAQQGIINGYDSNTFKPEAPLTGNHFMKMLLGALGYDGEVEGFTGPNWTINVSKLAYGLKLDDGNKDAVLSKPITRQEAALYAFNTLKADMVEYDTKTTVSKGDLTVQIAGTDAKKILQSESGYADTMEPNVAAKERTLQFAEKYFDKLTMTPNNTDDFGRPATEWKYKSEIIGTYTDYSDLKETYTSDAEKGELYNLIGSSIVKELSADGKNVNGVHSYDLDVYVDGEEVASPVVDNYFVKNSSGAAGVAGTKGTGVSGNGVLTQVFMDDDNNVTITMIDTFLVQATTDYNESKGSLNIDVINEVNEDITNPVSFPALKPTIDNDDVNVEGVKEDDYLLVTVSYKDETVSGEIITAEKAKVLTGKVSEYTETKNVVIDGTKYEYNTIIGEESGKQSAVTYTVGENAAVVLDQYGYILYVDEAVSTSSYVFVKEVDTAVGVGNKYAADLYFTDGTNDAARLVKVDGDTDSASLTGAAGKWMTYSKNSAGEYTLNSVPTGHTNKKSTSATNDSNKVDVMVNGQVKFMPGATTSDDLSATKGNSSTIVVVLESDNTVTSYTGVNNVPDITIPQNTSGIAGSQKASYNVVVDDKGYAEYVFVDLSAAKDAIVDDANSISDFMFLLNPTDHKTHVADDSYWQYEVLLDGKKETKFISDKLVASDDAGLLFRNVKENDKGYITKADLFNDASKRDVLTVTDKTITFNNDTVAIDATAGNADYTIASNASAKLLLLDGNPIMKDKDADYELYTGSVRGMVNMLKDYKVDAKVYIAVDDENSMVITDLYISVTKATSTNATPVPPAPTTGDYTVTFTGNTVSKIEYTGTGTATTDDAKAAIIDELKADGWTIKGIKTAGNTVTFSVSKVVNGYEETSEYTWDTASVTPVAMVTVKLNGTDVKVAKDSKVKDIKGIAGKWAFKEADVATFANPIDLTSGSDKVVAGTNYVDGFYKVTAPTAVTASGSKGAYSATVDVQYAKNGATVTVTVTTTTAATANTDTIKLTGVTGGNAATGQTAAALNSSLTFTYTQGAADSQATIDVTNA